MDLNRKTAYECLLQVEKEGAYSNIALNRLIAKNKPDKPAFVRELVHGVLKTKMTLDYDVSRFVTKGFNKLKPEELTVFRIGSYQLIFMDSVKDYAAVSETVNLAKEYMRGKDRFVNAVLRNIERARDAGDFGNEGLHKDAYREIKDETELLSLRFSAEKWIIELFTDTMGKSRAEAILEAYRGTPEPTVRVNVSKTSTEDLKAELEAAGFEANATEKSERALIVKGAGLTETAAYKAGKFSVQDLSSIIATDMATEDLVNADGPISVIDCCAAPGGKTFSVCERLKAVGVSALSTDIYPHKLELMKKEAERLGLDMIEFKRQDASVRMPERFESADLVLADVPCSGLGVLRRKPEIKYRQVFDLKSLTDVQYAIIKAAASYVKPGGLLVYSTCTLNPAENEQLVERFLADTDFAGQFTKERELLLTPDMGVDGFYTAKLRRTK